MCGIIGILCKDSCSKVLGKKLGVIVKESLISLEYRGYDSVGFALIDPSGKIVVRKSKGKILDVERKLEFDKYDGSIAIGHTRWATHGEPSDANAHPHVDCLNTIAVVHNGIIHNYIELKSQLVSRGHVFKSDTDTEVVPHILEELIAKGYSMLEAIRVLINLLRGAYALVILTIREPSKIFFVRTISPLVIGIHEEAMFIASDIPAFLRYTNKVVVLENGDYGYISSTDIYIENIHRGIVNWRKRVRVLDWTADMATKEGYPHFMLKEIHEQPIALRNTLASLRHEVPLIAKTIAEANRVFLTGCGTSFHAALAGEYMLNLLCGLGASAFIASEYARYRKVFRDGDLLIAISQSGETIDTLMAVREARARGAKVIAISNVLDSAIPRESDFAIYTRAGPEIGVAATKTFTAQLSALLLLSIEVTKILDSELKNNIEVIERELEVLPDTVRDVIHLYEPFAKKLAEKLKNKHSVFYLGRGIGVPLSMEGALKLKEIAYIHAEAYPAGESKHGPIALIEDGVPVIFSVFNDEYRELVVANIEEMKARKALTIGLVPKGFEEAKRKLDITIEMPILTPYTAAIVYAIPYQLIAYYTSVVKGLDPDKPRNLAKTVTVE